MLEELGLRRRLDRLIVQVHCLLFPAGDARQLRLHQQLLVEEAALLVGGPQAHLGEVLLAHLRPRLALLRGRLPVHRGEEQRLVETQLGLTEEAEDRRDPIGRQRGTLESLLVVLEQEGGLEAEYVVHRDPCLHSRELLPEDAIVERLEAVGRDRPLGEEHHRALAGGDEGGVDRLIEPALEVELLDRPVVQPVQLVPGDEPHQDHLHPGEADE